MTLNADDTMIADWSRQRGLVVLAVGDQWFYNGANFLAFKVAGNALHPLDGGVASLFARGCQSAAGRARPQATLDRLPVIALCLSALLLHAIDRRALDARTPSAPLTNRSY